jgi:hypothetical protein
VGVSSSSSSSSRCCCCCALVKHLQEQLQKMGGRGGGSSRSSSSKLVAGSSVVVGLGVAGLSHDTRTPLFDYIQCKSTTAKGKQMNPALPVLQWCAARCPAQPPACTGCDPAAAAAHLQQPQTPAHSTRNVAFRPLSMSQHSRKPV